VTITNAIRQLEQIREQHGDMDLVLADGAKEYQIADFGATWRSKENDVNQMEGHAQIRFRGPKEIIAYARDGSANRNSPYTVKFAALIEAFGKARKDGSEILVIAEPWVIGDTADELVESLSRLAGTDIGLIILHRRRAVPHGQN